MKSSDLQTSDCDDMNLDMITHSVCLTISNIQIFIVKCYTVLLYRSTTYLVFFTYSFIMYYFVSNVHCKKSIFTQIMKRKAKKSKK